MEESIAHIGMPSVDSFESKGDVVETTMMHEGKEFPICERVEYPPEGGIYLHYKGTPYPTKGFPFPDASLRNDIMKRMTLTLMKTIAGPEMIPSILAFALLPWPLKRRAINRILENYDRIGAWTFVGFYLKEDRYSNPARALRIILNGMVKELGLSAGVAQLPKTIATIIEYDDAYRFRMQDILSETSKEALHARPFREMKRITGILSKRELDNRVGKTIKVVGMLASTIMLYPPIRRAFRKSLEALSMKEWHWLQLDNADRYHVLLRADYNFTGRTIAERKNMYINVHTHSLCCHAGVIEKTIAPDTWETICKKCGNKCEWKQEFPPKMIVAPQQ